MHRLAGKAFGKYEDFTRLITSGKYIVTNIKKSVKSGETIAADLLCKLAAAAQIFIHTDDKLPQGKINVSPFIPRTVVVLESESFSVFPGGEISLN